MQHTNYRENYKQKKLKPKDSIKISLLMLTKLKGSKTILALKTNRRLEIENNRFTGRIPLDIASSAQLVVFDVSNNLFTGELPVGLTSLSLALDGNEISGTIPFDIISWKSLDTLTLSRNRISGGLPPKIGSLPNLNKLDLSANQISGSIPFDIGNLKLSFLNLSSNLLSGKIPFRLEAFDDSFFNNSGLRYDTEISNLVSCNSLSNRNSRRLSPKFIALIVVVVVVVAILLAVILVLVAIRSIYKRKQDDEEDSVTWKVIRFQRLVDFSESQILSGLNKDKKVVDFGVAKIVQAGQPFSASIVAGSFGCIAPEYGRTLKVNEKVDVYSFGVVLLELVTRREANKGDEDRRLAEWAAHRFLETPLDALLDEEVKEGCDVAEMTSVFRLGLMCTSTLPSNRPTMSEALQFLIRHCSSQEVYEKKALVTADNDVAPLLLSRHSDVDHSALEV
ncbi:receptor-like protein kinase 5 [Papaver somniferum]|uniref:receptor-like protein kinase 5 n=1 Tax=Papaver somniferum TaxID=3469 RepID=UPI000E6F5DFF|nr:receptor-like protein kinase 5 [Papaver somniferum]